MAMLHSSNCHPCSSCFVLLLSVQGNRWEKYSYGGVPLVWFTGAGGGGRAGSFDDSLWYIKSLTLLLTTRNTWTSTWGYVWILKVKELKKRFQFAWSYHFSAFQTTVMCIVSSNGLDPLPLMESKKRTLWKRSAGLNWSWRSEWLYL